MQITQTERIKDLWEENIKLANENIELKKQIQELGTLNKSYLKATITQTDKVNALEDRLSNLNAQVRLLVAIIRDGEQEDEQETTQGASQRK